MVRPFRVLLTAVLIGVASAAAALGAPLGLTVVKAEAAPDSEVGKAVLVIDLDPASTSAFGTFTTENVGREVAISVAGAVVASPVIREPILGGRIAVSGMAGDEARRLAQELAAGGALAVEVVDGQGAGTDDP